MATALVLAWLKAVTSTAYLGAIAALRSDLDARRLREEWITEWMATAPEPLRSWIVRTLAKAADLDPYGLILVSAHDSTWRRRGSGRAPDLLLVDGDGDIRLVVEVKAWANVNWGWGCCELPDLWCSQPVYYVHGRWTDRDLSKAKFLLLAPEKRWGHWLKAMDEGAEAHGISTSTLPWEMLDLRAVFEEAGRLAKTTEDAELAAQAAAFHHLVSYWYWADAVEGVPRVAA